MCNKKLAIVTFLFAVVSLSVKAQEGETCLKLTGMLGQAEISIKDHLGFVPYISQFEYPEEIFHTLLNKDKQYWQQYLKEFHNSELSEELLNTHNKKIAGEYLKSIEQIRDILSRIVPQALFYRVIVQSQTPGYIHFIFFSSHLRYDRLMLEPGCLPWKEGKTYLKFTTQTAEQGLDVPNHLGFVPCMLQFESPMDMFHHLFNTDEEYWQQYLKQFHDSEAQVSLDTIVDEYLKIIDQMHSILLEILPKNLHHGVIIKERRQDYLHFRFDPGLARIKMWENSTSGTVVGLGYFPSWGYGISRAESGGGNYVETYSRYRSLNMLD